MTIWYGGDYNPEQWDESVWDEDIRLMQQAGVSLVSLGIFAWSMIEPREGEFEFGWLDRIVEKLHAGGISIDLATATASPPPWLSHRYPDTLPVTADGVRLQIGSRQQYCPSSATFRRLATRITRAIAERYGSHPAVVLWHVGNEYGCHVSHCYCEVSAASFRAWLRSRYVTVEALNDAWGTAFWSQRYSEFDEVRTPSTAPVFRNPAQLLDFDRFSSDELLECFRAEVRVIRELSPHVPITTNFMGFFKPVDYWKWAQEVDIISDDSYPDPADPRSPAWAAMSRDLMRSLGGGRPWILMEQATSAVTWRLRNAVKPSGAQRAGSMQALARGADGILFFQWRQSTSGAEKFLTGMLPHAGVETRVWREVEALGAELATLGDVVGDPVPARVAIVLDWDSWWSLGQDALPSHLDYLQGVFGWYSALWEKNITVDFVAACGDLGKYAVVIAPTLFVTADEVLDNLARYAKQGGHLVVTYQSGIVDVNSRIVAGGYLGRLQRTLGVWVEEFAPLASPDLLSTETSAGPKPMAVITGDVTGELDVREWTEFVHAPDAKVLSRFVGGAVDGWPALTRRRSAGGGAAWYVATQPDARGAATMVDLFLAEAGVSGILDRPVPGIEAVRRGDRVFLINHGSQTVSVDGVTLEPYGVHIGQTT